MRSPSLIAGLCYFVRSILPVSQLGDVPILPCPIANAHSSETSGEERILLRTRLTARNGGCVSLTCRLRDTLGVHSRMLHS